MKQKPLKINLSTPFEYTEFWNKVKKFADVDHISLSSLAKKIGTSKTTLLYWQKNKKCPSADAYIKLCKFLGIFDCPQYFNLFMQEEELSFHPDSIKVKKNKSAIRIFERARCFKEYNNVIKLEEYSRLLELDEEISSEQGSNIRKERSKK